jgi:3-hydroxymyristoyl/3-hydroxydecanoyl-(acyl carrier protein) dehydratase
VEPALPPRLTASAATFDAAALHGLLAHRFPFLLVDRVVVLEPGRRVRGIRSVTGGEWWAEEDVRGATWDGTPGLPHALVLEALAQTSGVLLADVVPADDDAVAYFLGLDRVRLRDHARPGEQLQLDLELRQWRRGICRTRGVATVDGRLIASAELTTIVRARPRA